MTNPDAASVFYSNLSNHLDVQSMVKFIIVLSKCLKSAVDESQASQLKDMKKSKKRHIHSSKSTKDSTKADHKPS